MRHYVVTIEQEDNIDEVIVKAKSAASAIKVVTDGMITARLATVEDALRIGEERLNFLDTDEPVEDEPVIEDEQESE